MAKLAITLKKSIFGTLDVHKRNAEALGLHKIGATRVHPDNEATRGKIHAIRHMVEVKEIKE